MALSAIVATLSGGTAGLLGSTLPHVVDLVKTQYERKHDLEMRRLDVEAAQSHALEEVAEATTKVVRCEAEHAEQPIAPPSLAPVGTCRWIDLISDLVRPLITYAFFGLFLAVKIVGLYVVMHYQHAPVSSAMATIWDDNAQVTFVAVLAYWFGQRSLAQFDSST